MRAQRHARSSATATAIAVTGRAPATTMFRSRSGKLAPYVPGLLRLLVNMPSRKNRKPVFSRS